jgi:hypothetical protein
MQNGVQLFGFLPEAKNMSIFLPVHSDQIKWDEHHALQNLCNSTMSRPQVLKTMSACFLLANLYSFSSIVVHQGTSFIVHPHILEFVFKCNTAKNFNH